VLNVGRLRVLRELHHRKTLSAVAEALSYSTSAVSQQVRLLEKEVGVPLVEPIGRRLKLTPQGLMLVGHAEKILDLLERAEADISSSMDQPSGVVKIAAFQTAAMTFLPRVAQELQNLHPGLILQFHQGEPEATLPALQSAEYDLVIAESYPGIPMPRVPGIRYITLFEDPLWLVVDSAAAAHLHPDKDIIAQLSGAGWAVEAEESAPRTWIINECRKAGFEPRIVCASEDLAVQLRFVEAGLAVAVLPDLALENAGSNIRKLATAPGIQSRKVILAARDASKERPAIVATAKALQRAGEDYGFRAS
jgi:DNA-binding transcriptional LysR family regulator